MAVSPRSLRAGKAFIELALTGEDAVVRRIAGVERRLRGVGGRLSSIGTAGIAGGGFGSLINLFLGAKAAEALLYPIRLAGRLERATAQLTVLTGSAEKAVAMIAELEQFSRVSIIPVDEMERAAAVLLNFGEKSELVTPAVKALAAVAQGQTHRFQLLAKAYADVRSKQQFYFEELRQMANAGFNPLREIMDKTGESMKEVRARMQAGGVSADEVTDALMRAVSEGGRFEGILEKLSGTTFGLIDQVRALARLAIRPLGQAALPILNRMLEKTLEFLPAFKELIAANAKYYVVLLGGLAGVTLLAAGLLATGLAAQIAAFSLGGLLLLLKGVLAGAGLLLSPFGAMVSLLSLGMAELMGLTNFTPIASRNLTALAKTMGGNFAAARDVALKAFGGIATALRAGDIPAAADVLWAGLELAWVEGTDRLRELWVDFKTFFLRTTTEILFGVQEQFARFKTAPKKLGSELVRGFLDLGQSLGGEAFKLLFGTGDGLLEGAVDQFIGEKIVGRDRRSKKADRENDARLQEELARIEADRDVARENEDRRHSEDLEAARKRRDEARKRFDEALKNADQPPLDADFGGLGFGGMVDRLFEAQRAGAGAGALAEGTGLLDVRNAQQIFGGPQKNIEKLLREQLAEQRELRKAVEADRKFGAGPGGIKIGK